MGAMFYVSRFKGRHEALGVEGESDEGKTYESSAWNAMSKILFFVFCFS